MLECVANVAAAGREGMGGSVLLLPSFYQPKISPVEVVSSVLISIQMFLWRVSKGLESFNRNKSF